ncbi:MAG: thioredoxin reductase [Homoserinimonas sp.]|jgi:thioredoxin reductase|nr:thioredoxin reductase [Homoserinimonas sp.]
MDGKTDYDVVVIGAGAAGLSAALVLARSLCRVLVVDTGEPRNRFSEHVHGFLGRDGSAPHTLLAEGRQEVLGYGVTIVEARATRVVGRINRFTVDLSIKQSVTARRIVSAAGMRDTLPNIAGLHSLWGTRVLHCPYCHGWELRGRRIAVIAWNRHVVPAALLLSRWSARLTVFEHDQVIGEGQRRLMHARGLTLIPGTLQRIMPTVVGGVTLDLGNGETHEFDAAFVTPVGIPNDSYLESLDCQRSGAGFVSTDDAGETTVAGIFAVGNVTDPLAQVIGATAQGARAAQAITESLAGEEVSVSKTSGD